MTGKQLVALRQAHGLTQKALGAMLGYTANYIARLEREKENDKPLLITPRCEKLIRMLLPEKKVKKSS